MKAMKALTHDGPLYASGFVPPFYRYDCVIPPGNSQFAAHGMFHTVKWIWTGARAVFRVLNAAQNKRKSCLKQRNLPILRRMMTRAIAAEKQQVFDPVKRSVRDPCAYACNVLGLNAKR
jgi:hypothetical protein